MNLYNLIPVLPAINLFSSFFGTLSNNQTFEGRSPSNSNSTNLPYNGFIENAEASMFLYAPKSLLAINQEVGTREEEIENDKKNEKWFEIREAAREKKRELAEKENKPTASCKNQKPISSQIRFV
jgi:hypothetical protein